MSTVKVSDATFKKEVIDASSEKLVLVDFWAEWCGPCRMIAPILDTLSEELKDSVKICKVEIDENPEHPTQFGVRSIPTFCIFKDGQLLSTKVGALPKDAINSWLKEHM
jgi:thioredoxin 1